MCRILGNLEPRLVLPPTAWVAQQVWVPAAPGPTAPGSGFLCLLGSHVPQVLPPQLWCRPPDPQLKEHLSRAPHTCALCQGPVGGLPQLRSSWRTRCPEAGLPSLGLTERKLRPGFLSAQGITCLEVCSLARMGWSGCLRVWGAPGVTAPGGPSQEPSPMSLLTTCLLKPRSPSPRPPWGSSLALTRPWPRAGGGRGCHTAECPGGCLGVRGPPHHPHTAPSCPLSRRPHPQGVGVTAPILWMRKLRLQVP